MNKHYIKGALVALLLSVSLALYSQGTVGINSTGNPPNASAVLDLSNNPNLGFLMTNVNLASTADIVTIPAPTVGMIVWNTNAALPLGVGFYYWSGTAWLYITNSGVVGGSLTGSGTTGYSARWTSATALANGVAQDNGTGVSISSTALTPVNKLDVNGNAAFGTYAGTAAPSNGLIVSGNVGIGTNAPNASATLDITSTTQGLLPPRIPGASISLIATPATGLVVLNSTTNCLEYYTGTAWLNLACPCNTRPDMPGAITGNTAACASTTGNVYTILPILNATSYIWTVPPGATITANTGTSITVTMGATSGYITVAAVNSCGTSAPSVLALTISNGIPAAPAVPSGTTAPAISTANTYTIAAVAGATNYSWSVSSTNGTVTAGQGTTSVTITFSGTAATMNICVTASNVCGTSAPSCLSVTSTTCAHGTVPTFTYSNSVQTWTIPACVTQITITAVGGAGGYGQYTATPVAGGNGATIIGVVTVTGGHTLNIVTGGVGGGDNSDDGGGGGGGTFIWDNNTGTVLEVAGGGGGGGYITGNIGAPGSLTTTPTVGTGTADAAAGTGEGGGGGALGTYGAAGGAGYLGNGVNGYGSSTGGNDKANNFTAVAGYDGTDPGGYGGGGGGGDYGGGGGGGYNGGGGGGDPDTGGAGGGSYCAGTISSTAQTNTGNGSVIIQY